MNIFNRVNRTNIKQTLQPPISDTVSLIIQTHEVWFEMFSILFYYGKRTHSLWNDFIFALLTRSSQSTEFKSFSSDSVLFFSPEIFFHLNLNQTSIYFVTNAVAAALLWFQKAPLNHAFFSSGVFTLCSQNLIFKH